MLSVLPLSWAENVVSDNPEQVIHDLQNALIQAMREGDNMNYQERVDFLAPIINQSHDFDLIIRTVLGGNWNQLDSDQQRLISDTFRQLSIATYAGQFKDFGGEQFEILQQRALPREQMLMRSQLTKADKSTVDFDYVLQQGNAGWQIVNILVDGVSDLALKRSEYRSILQRDGFQALIELLKKKILLAEHG
ncbi:MAG: ABC transporter substrate-binding protein [Nitrosomonas sp.]|nr:ABC transporter substrate-binding protein [Nitrosomonas sp.]